MRSGAVARSLRILDKENQGSDPVQHVKPWGSIVTLHCSSYISEYLSIVSGGYLGMNSFHALTAVWLDASHRSLDSVGLNRSSWV